jgi:hypothetical protein
VTLQKLELTLLGSEELGQERFEQHLLCFHYLREESAQKVLHGDFL